MKYIKILLVLTLLYSGNCFGQEVTLTKDSLYCKNIDITALTYIIDAFKVQDYEAAGKYLTTCITCKKADRDQPVYFEGLMNSRGVVQIRFRGDTQHFYTYKGNLRQ